MNNWKLPSFMRKTELKKYKNENKLFYIYYNDKIVGFYVLDGSMFKNLFILPEYRNLGLATKTISKIANSQYITICTTRRNCGIKRLIVKLGFCYTGIEVQGKQSILQIWENRMLAHKIFQKSIDK